MESLLIELNDLNTELKRLQEKCKEMRKHKRTIEERIMKYMKKNKRDVLQNNRIIIELEEKERHKKATKNAKEQSIIKVLQEQGITPNANLVNQLIRSTRGESVATTTLKTKAK